MKIRKGRKEDAPFLANVVMEAIGEELCVGLAGDEGRVALVRDLFTVLAGEKESQYSYNNSFVAVNDEGEPIGGIIAYDGAKLRRLRRAFARGARRILDWDTTEEDSEGWEDEAESGEIYIDSLYVRPEYRRRGVARALVGEVAKRYESLQKPLGLLVEPENEKALRAYRSWGFEEKGISNFFRTPMIHMQASGINRYRRFA